MISTENQGQVLVVRVNTVRLDSAVGTLIRTTVIAQLDSVSRVALDISQVKLVDSGGLGSLVALLKNVVSKQGKLALVGMHKSVRMMFELSRMDRQFLLVDQLDAALSTLNNA